jgi:hypothetical protein
MGLRTGGFWFCIVLYLGFRLTTNDLGFPHRIRMVTEKMAPEPLMSVRASVTIRSPAMGATTYERRGVGGGVARAGTAVRGAASGAVGAGEEEAGPGEEERRHGRVAAGCGYEWEEARVPCLFDAES